VSCTRDQAERLARAIRLRTITIIGAEPAGDRSFAAFEDFFAFLRVEFPRAAGRLRWERVSALGLLGAWLPPSAGAAPGGLLLYAHCDVVPPGDESRWTHAPFGGETAEGYVWGRGTLDDKGVLLAILEAVEALIAGGFEPAKPVYIAIGCDEETEGRGARAIAARLAADGIRPDWMLDEGSVIADGVLPFLGRPAALVGTAEKGVVDVEIRVDGAAGHASMPGARTAAGVLAAVIADLERHPFPARLTPAVSGMFRCLGRGAGPAVRAALAVARPLLPLACGALGPQLAAMLRTTQAVTRLAAGEADNVLPSSAAAHVNLRILPGDTPAGVLARLARRTARRVPRGFRGSVRATGDPHDPVAASPASGPAWDAIGATLRELLPEAVLAPMLVTACTDSRHFAGIAGAIYRLMPALLDSSEIARIHGVDERLSLDNYGRMIAYYGRVIARLARGGC
jgi:carboxypeptidase PM20D1